MKAHVFLLVVIIALSSCAGRDKLSLSVDAVEDAGALSDSGERQVDVAVDALPSDGPQPVPDAAGDGTGMPDSVTDLVTPPDLADVSSPDTVVPPDTEQDLSPTPPGCCLTDSDCPDLDSGWEMVCVWPGWEDDPFGVCMPLPEAGWCWADEDCKVEEECHGAAACPCNVDCDMDYEGPGVCVPAGAQCAPIKKKWVKEWCNAANLVIWDGEKCLPTCFGCCECKPFCEFTYQTMDECLAACSPGCQIFDGGCDAAIPEEPWWYFNGQGCFMEDSCVCEGCPGTYATQGQCEMACFGQFQDDCPTYVGALADCPFYYQQGFQEDSCVTTGALPERCESDLDCVFGDGAFFGDYCVLGNCVYCWQDTQCPAPQVCRAGRCVDELASCPPTGGCQGFGCKVIHPSEEPCPVCLCESTYSIECEEDAFCLLFSFHPFSRCVNGRCADCINDADCGEWGHCLPPGVCYEMTPPMHTLYGTWLIGWWGALNHYSYFRFEPDGTLRRGAYADGDLWSDDIPNLPCYPGWEIDYPLLGTWEPEITQSGFLVIRMTLNIVCDGGQGWTARYMVTPSEDGLAATFDDIDSDTDYDAMKVPTWKCEPDMSSCEEPDLF